MMTSAAAIEWAVVWRRLGLDSSGQHVTSVRLCCVLFWEKPPRRQFWGGLAGARNADMEVPDWREESLNYPLFRLAAWVKSGKT